MKKTLSVLLAVIIVLSSFTAASLAVSQIDYGITATQTPTASATVKFTKQFGMNYKGAPTPPLVVGDTLLVVSGVMLYKLNAENGEVMTSVKMVGSSLYSTMMPLYADGKVFVQLDGGIVQAFDYETMQSLWVYTDSLGGQALCPIVYDNGYVYTGFWNDETEKASYVCLSVKDENTSSQTEAKKARWTYGAKGGFYWAGCAVTESFVVFGKDNGKEGSTENSKIIAVNKNNGKSVSTLTVKGDIRSSVVYSEETDAYYVSSKGGYVYKFSMNSSTGKLSSLKSYKASGSVTATPIVHNKRLYVGCQDSGAGKFIVLDAETMKEIYTESMQGYPQATMLVSTGYESETGKVYIYSAYNKAPGGITVFEDSAGQTTAVKTELYTPEEKLSQYCISTISAGADGTLYYKNDSGYIIAIGENSGFWYNLGRLLGNIIAVFLKLMGLVTGLQ